MMKKRSTIKFTSQSALHQSIIAVVLTSLVPLLSLLYIGAMIWLKPAELATTDQIIVFISTVLLSIAGLLILLKFPINIIRLRQYVTNVATGILPDQINLLNTQSSDDLKYIENGLNIVLEEMRRQVETAKEVQRAEEKLRRSEQLNRNLVKHLPLRIFIKDLDSVYVTCNENYAHDLGIEPEQVVEKDDFAFFPRDLAESYRADDQMVMTSGTMKNIEEEYVVDGERRWVHTIKVPYCNEGGEVSGILGIFEDITGRKRTEVELLESEEKFRLMTATARDAIIMLDHEGKVSFWNQAAADMLGYPEDEVLGREMHERLLPDRYREAHRKAFERFRNTGEGASIGKTLELVARRKDGEEIPIELSVSGFKLKDRWNAFGIMRDITERKRAEEVSKERNLLCSLMDHSDDLIYFKDLRSRFVRCSAAQTERFQSLGIDDVIGKTDHDFFSEEHAEDALRDEQEIIRTGEALIGKVEKETWPDGRVSWVLTSKMPLRNESGGIIGTFGISKDITAMKESEEKLKVLHRQLLEASREAGKAEVATSVLHNIGNVLNSVNVSSVMIAEKIRESKISSLPKVVELLDAHGNDLPGFFSEDSRGRQLPAYLESLAGRLAEEQEEILCEMETLAGNLRHVKEVLAMQQSFAKTQGVTEILPVADLVEDALRLSLGSMELREIELRREYMLIPPISIEKHKVLQIVGNLIRNARHACNESGRPDKRIILRTAKAGSRVLISVEDNGVGIAPENLVRIFSHGFTTRKDGYGFGLHSSALTAKELGGSLAVFSEGPGKGAAFTLELPLNHQRTNDDEI